MEIKAGYELEKRFDRYLAEAEAAGRIRGFVRHPHYSEKDKVGVDFEIDLGGRIVKVDVCIHERLAEKIEEAGRKEMDCVITDRLLRNYRPTEINDLVERAVYYWRLVREGHQY